MPGLITHYICGEAVLNKLDRSKQKQIKEYRQLYNIGTQGPDVFFYYIPGLMKKNMRDLGTKMHRNNFKIFIENVIESVYNSSKVEQDAAFSYLCGYITHYALDYNTHPYIYYKSGFKEEGGRSLRYSVYHRNMETAIDVMMLRLFNSEKPSDKKLWQLIRTNYPEAMHISDILSSSINEAYDSDISGKHVYKAMAYMCRLTRIMQSRSGKRKRLMKLVEDLTIGENLFSSIIHLQEMTDGRDYLNIKKAEWKLPWDNQAVKRDSFTQLYDKSVDDAVKMIDSIFSYFADKISKEELLRIIGNNSLATGIDCEQKVNWRYYELIYE